jgi:hypothetical protein
MFHQVPSRTSLSIISQSVVLFAIPNSVNLNIIKTNFGHQHLQQYFIQVKSICTELQVRAIKIYFYGNHVTHGSKGQ